MKNKCQRLLIVILSFGIFSCSSSKAVFKFNEINIKNYPESITYITLKDGRKIDFRNSDKLSYVLKEETILIIEKNEVKEEILFSDILNFEAKEKHKTDLLKTGLVIGGFLGALGLLIVLNSLTSVQ